MRASNCGPAPRLRSPSTYKRIRHGNQESRHHRRRTARGCTRATALKGRGTIPIVRGTLVGVAQDLVGMRDLLEHLLGLLVARILVGVVLHRLLAVGLLQVLRRHAPLNAEQFVVVVPRHDKLRLEEVGTPPGGADASGSLPSACPPVWVRSKRQPRPRAAAGRSRSIRCAPRSGHALPSRPGSADAKSTRAGAGQRAGQRD